MMHAQIEGVGEDALRKRLWMNYIAQNTLNEVHNL